MPRSIELERDSEREGDECEVGRDVGNEADGRELELMEPGLSGVRHSANGVTVAPVV